MEIIDKPTADFIREHRNDDVRKLAFASDKYPSVDFPLALDQIQGWQTARHKLPSWAAIDGIVYPPHLNMEQCSSEQTARYKKRITTSQTSPKTSPDPSEGGEMENTFVVEPKFNTVTKAPSLREGWGRSQGWSGLIDLTGGFGVDFSFMSRGFEHAIYVEQNPQLCKIAEYNFKLLGLTNFEVVNADGVEYLKHCPPVSVIYLDPARRDTHGNRVYNISDCQPDVVELAPLLLKKARKVIVKLSPMFDWHEAVRELPCVTAIHIVSVKNECKELVVEMETTDSLAASPDPSKGGEMKNTFVAEGGNGGNEPMLYCVNDDEVFSCPIDESSVSSVTLSNNETSVRLSKKNSSVSSVTLSNNELSVRLSQDLPSVLLVPNSSIMKAGCFDAVAKKFSVQPVSRNSHLFVAPNPVADFPGRQFRIVSVCSMNKKELRRSLAGIKKANVSVRNFPMSVEALRKRLKIGDGGDFYIFATTVADGSHVLIISKKLY